MNNNLLTIDNMMFVGTGVAATPATTPNKAEKAVQLSPIAEDTPTPSKITEQTTTDNKYPITHKEPVNKPQQDFNHTLRKTTAKKTPLQDKDNIKSKESSPDSHISIKKDIVQNRLVQASQTLENSKEDNPTITAKSQISRELTQLLNNLKANKSSSEALKTTESAEIKLPAEQKVQSVPKTVLQKVSNSQPEIQTFLSKTTKSTPISDTQPEQGKNTNNENQIPNEPVLNVLVNDSSKTTVTNEKTAMSNTSTLTNSQEILTSKSSKLTQGNPIDDQAKITDTNKETAILDKKIISTNQKPITSSTNSPSVQAKSSELKSQYIDIASEKSTQTTEKSLVAEKPVNNKVTTSQTLSESTQSNSKELQQPGNKTSEAPTIREELNVTEFQVSTNQTKYQSSTTSNKSFNSDSEQNVPHNNPQTPITEQSPISSESAKTTNMPAQSSPNDVSTNVSKQILESIQSSLSQQRQDQQITVHLNPPELGKVLIKFQEQDGQITGLLEVSKTETRIEIQQAIPQIMRSLQDSGIQVKRVDIVLSEGEQPEQGALKDQSLSNGWAQPQDSANPHTGTNNPNSSGINEWLTNNKNYYNTSELQEAFATNSSINMLV